MAHREARKGPKLSGLFMSPDSIRLPAFIVEALYGHAQASPEKEVCGLLAVKGEVVAGHYRIQNTAADPRHHFEMDPRQQIDAFRSMRGRGEELFAVYHSHPQGPVQPSVLDVSRHEYPQAYCLVISLHHQDRPELGAYRINNGIFTRVGLEVGTS